MLIAWLTLLLSVGNCCTADDSLDAAEPRKIRNERLFIVLGGTAASLTVAHLQNYNSWWKGERSTFHFGEDGTYTLGADKLGHFYFTYLSSDLLSSSFKWAGMESRMALLAGASISFAFQLYVEIEDGFTKVLGFSPGDAAADIAGAFYPLLQYHEPLLQQIRFKWSVIPSPKYKQGYFNTIIDDYESMYFWLSLGHEGLPSIVRSIFPPFLSITLGYGVKKLDRERGGEREIFIGIDYDFNKFPGEGSFLSTVKHVLNFLHLPAPTIRLTPSIIMYGFR